MGKSDEKAVEESRTTDHEQTSARGRREPHRNPLCRALVEEHPHWTDPPGTDTLLSWRFCFADGELGVSSGFGIVADLALSGIAVRAPYDDGRSRQARVLGKLDSPNAVTKTRGVDVVLKVLPSLHVDVLRLTYGPQRYISGSPYWHPQVYARLGYRATVMPLTPRCVSKFGPDYAAAGKWLLEMIAPSKMKLVDIEEVRVLDRQAEALVFEASNRWRDCRGRRRHVAKYNDEATMRRDRE